MECIMMKISDFLPKKDYPKFRQLVPGWEYSEEYSEDKIDTLDELLEELEQHKGYDTEDGVFLGDVINKLRTNPKY